MCVCVCVRERDKERKGEKRGREPRGWMGWKKHCKLSDNHRRRPHTQSDSQDTCCRCTASIKGERLQLFLIPAHRSISTVFFQLHHLN